MDKDEAATFGIEDFFTRDSANDGIRLPLVLPDGTPTSHWLDIRGIDSDAFCEEEADSFRRGLQLASEKDEAKRKLARKEEDLRVTATLVKGWSFEKPCALDNVIALLRNAPQIKKQVEVAAYDRARFFKKGPDSSSGTPKPSSDSTAASTEQTKPSDVTSST